MSAGRHRRHVADSRAAASERRSRRHGCPSSCASPKAANPGRRGRRQRSDRVVHGAGRGPLRSGLDTALERTRGVRPIIPLPTRTGRIRLPVRVPSSGTNVGRPTSDAVAVAGWRQGRSFSPTRRDQAPIGARWLRPGIGAGVIRDLPRVRLSADVLAIAGSSVRCASIMCGIPRRQSRRMCGSFHASSHNGRSHRKSERRRR